MNKYGVTDTKIWDEKAWIGECVVVSKRVVLNAYAEKYRGVVFGVGGTGMKSHLNIITYQESEYSFEGLEKEYVLLEDYLDGKIKIEVIGR